MALNVAAVAIPLAFVVAVVVVDAPNRPDAPDPGAEKVTTAPGTTLPPASLTMTDRLVVKLSVIVADWPSPALTTMVVAAPGVFVIAKLIEGPPEKVAAMLKMPVVELAVSAVAIATPEALVATV